MPDGTTITALFIGLLALLNAWTTYQLKKDAEAEKIRNVKVAEKVDRNEHAVEVVRVLANGASAKLLTEKVVDKKRIYALDATDDNKNAVDAAELALKEHNEKQAVADALALRSATAPPK